MANSVPNYQLEPSIAIRSNTDPRSIQKKKYLILGLYLVLLFLSSSLYFLMDETSADRAMTLYGIGISILPFLWCKYDAKQHQKHIDKLTSALIVLTSIMGIAIYFGKVRRRTFGECASIFFLLSLVFAGVFFAGAYTLTYVFYYLNPQADIFQTVSSSY